MTGLFDPSNPFGRTDLLSALVRFAKHKVYFSFRVDDIVRVNVVREAWQIDHPDAPQMRSFYDSSLWQCRPLEAPGSLKRLIREGVENTSAVCVVAGSQTWSSRWVRYEIARAVIDNRGLLTVHLNNIRHHVSQKPDTLGFNPLAYMAVGKFRVKAHLPPVYYLYEYRCRGTQDGWYPYEDFTSSVRLPRYLADPPLGYVMPLSSGTASYDHITDDGHKNIGTWIDLAAQQVGLQYSVSMERTLRRVCRTPAQQLSVI